MGRPVTRPITWKFILRTLKRLDIVAARIDAELLAKELMARGVEIPCPQYLDDTWYYWCKLMKEAGRDPNAHPNGNCPQCGEDIGRDHKGAKYCSNRCKQRAYRERLNINVSQRNVTNRPFETLQLQTWENKRNAVK